MVLCVAIFKGESSLKKMRSETASERRFGEERKAWWLFGG